MGAESGNGRWFVNGKKDCRAGWDEIGRRMRVAVGIVSRRGAESGGSSVVSMLRVMVWRDGVRSDEGFTTK